jgi:transposase
MYYVGIDWGTEEHQVSVMSQAGQSISELVIQHTWAGFEQLSHTLKELGPVEINLERPNGLLVEWLVSQGWPVYFTPPHIVGKRRRRASKDDRRDSRQLAQLMRDHDPDCQRVCFSSEAAEGLRQLVQAYDQLAQEQRRLSNQLRAVLTNYYPSALGLFNRLHQPLTLAFLQVFPTPQQAQAASREDLVAFFRSQAYRYMQRVEHHYQCLQQPMPTARVQQGWVPHMLALVALLHTLHDQLQHLQRLIRQAFTAHPEAAWWRALPAGKGDLTLPRLMAYFGDQRDRFSSFQMLQAIAGTAPITQQSGKRRLVSFRLACSRPFRRAISDFARLSLHHSGWAKAYYLNQLALGHSKARALRALANSWLRILWTIWQRHELYSESKHLSHQLRQGILSPASLSLAA